MHPENFSRAKAMSTMWKTPSLPSKIDILCYIMVYTIVSEIVGGICPRSHIIKTPWLSCRVTLLSLLWRLRCCCQMGGKDEYLISNVH